MPPVIPTDRPGGLGFPNHRGDRGSPSASVASAKPDEALAQHTPVSPEEAYAQFSAFVERYTAALVRYARSGDTDFHLAEDFVQAAHLKLWARWQRTGELITNFAYSCTVVRSVKIDYYRAIKNRFAVATDFSAEALGAENHDVEYVPKYTEAFRREVAKLTPQIRPRPTFGEAHLQRRGRGHAFALAEQLGPNCELLNVLVGIRARRPRAPSLRGEEVCSRARAGLP